MATLIQDTVYEKSSLGSQMDAVGSGLARYGLAVVVAWIGLLKFTAYEAEGISPFVVRVPLTGSQTSSAAWNAMPASDTGRPVRKDENSGAQLSLYCSYEDING